MSAGIGVQIAARRSASLRMEPLENGHRDPLEDREPFTETAVRDLCNQLWSMGFKVEYLEARYGVRSEK